MTTAADVAKHLIHLAGADPEGEPMTAMRLHKLLYYCQGWHLAWYGRPLFADRIEAWKYGPVVPAVYDLPWGKGKEPITDPGSPANLSRRERAVVDQVWGHYCRFSACGLRDKTHDEPPWKDHYTPDQNARCTREIPPAELSGYFGGEFRRMTGEEPGSMTEAETNAAAGRGIPLDRLRAELGC